MCLLAIQERHRSMEENPPEEEQYEKVAAYMHWITPFERASWRQKEDAALIWAALGPNRETYFNG